MELKCKEISKVDKKQIKQAMIEKNIHSLRQLSDMTGVHRTLLTNWFNGKITLSDKNWKKVRDTLLTWD